jgi:hypothetical protein
MKLTEAQVKVLRILYEEKVDLHDRVLGPGYIGARIWGKSYRKPQAYARTAGRVLNALREKGLADWRSEITVLAEPDYGWTITFEGKKIMEEIDGKEKGKESGGHAEGKEGVVHRDKRRRR